MLVLLSVQGHPVIPWMTASASVEQAIDFAQFLSKCSAIN